jgi:chromate transporter
MPAFAYGVESHRDALGGGWLHGLQVVAVAVVAQAVWGMARALCPDRERFSLAAATLLVLAVPTVLGQIGAILGGGLAGWLLLKPPETRGHVEMPVPVSRGFAAVNLVAFFLLLGGLPLLAAATGTPALAIFDGFYRTGPWFSAADTWCCPCCSRRWCRRGGSPRTSSWRATEPRKRSPVPSSLSPLTWAP